MANEFKVKKGLIVQGSGSVILDIQGSQGQLFSVTDNLSGSLFSVNDISGLPILQVSSDDSVKLGTFNAEAIKVSGSVAIITGSFSGSFSGNAFVQGGNSFGATATLGTNDIQSLALETSGSTRLFVSSSGNVGIGTTTPSDVLTVNGNIRPVASTDTGIYGFDAATGGSKIYSITRATSMSSNDLNINAYNGFGIKVNATSTSLVKSGHEFFISSSGNVGIGTTTPGELLEIYSGNIRLRQGYKYAWRNSGAVDDAYISSTSTSMSFSVYSGSFNFISSAGSGNVGIGTTTPQYKLDVSGSGRFTNGLTVTGSINTADSINMFGTAYTGTSKTIVTLPNNYYGSPSSSIDFIPNLSGTGNDAIRISTPAGQLRIYNTTYTYNYIDLLAGGNTVFSTSGPNTGTTFTINTGGSLNASFNWDNTIGFNSMTSAARPYRFLGATNYSFTSSVSIGKDLSNAKLDVSGSAIISGSLTVTGDITGSNAIFSGTITAQKLVVSTISSSILYSSGSNKFGNDLTNTHQFTGSVYITGSSFNFNNGIGTYTLSGYNFIAPSSFLIQASAGYLKINNPVTAVHLGASTGYTGIGPAFLTSQAPSAILHVSGASNQPLYLIESPAAPSALFVSGSGNVGIGTTSPAQTLHVVGTMRYGNLANTNYLEFNQIGGGTQILSNSGKEIYFYPEGNSGIGIIKTATGAGMSIGVSYFTTTPPDNGLLVQGNVGIGTISPSASLHVNGSAIITGSLTIGSSSLGSTENTLALGPPMAGGLGEGGQILLQASGGLYTSASMLDNWQNTFRILRGTNASSDATVANWNLHTKQMQLPQYTNASSFVGTATANLAVDSGGNIITVSTSGGSVFPYTGNAVITGSLTTTGVIYAQPNGGMYFQGGDDVALYDINISNHIGIYGVQDSTVGSIKLGSGGGVISGKNNNIGIGTLTPNAKLDVAGSITASGSLTVTGSVTITGAMNSGNVQINSGAWLYWGNGTTIQSPSTNALTFINTAGTAYSSLTTGNTLVTGSLTVTNGITGSLQGTSSWATNALTASYADNFTVAGTITAQKLVVQTITSSVLYSSGSNIFGNNISNTQVFTGSLFQTGSTAAFMGNVGIGTTTPGQLLDINAGSAGTSIIRFTAGGGVNVAQLGFVAGYGAVVGATSGNSMFVHGTSIKFVSHDLLTEWMRIINNGNVGIGTTTPNARLDVSGSINISGSGTQIPFQITSGSTSLMFVSSSGNIGISTATPTQLLDILGVNKDAYISALVDTTGKYAGINIGLSGSYGGSLYYNTGTKQLRLGTTGGPGNDSAGILVFATGTNTERMRIDSTGNVGIGTTTPNAKLDVSGSVNISGSGTQIPFQITSGSTSILFVSGSGRVGIGTATPLEALDITGNLNIAGFIYRTGLSGKRAILYTGGNSEILDLHDNGGTTKISIAANGFSYFNGGNVGIRTTEPSASLHVAGTTILSSSFNTAISGSTLKVQGSGSTQPIFTVVGSQGELFSINDSLSGSLFSVNDISGLPILEVFSDNTILLGNYQAPTLYTTNRIASTALGSNVIYSLPTSSYDGVFMDYTVKSGSNARAGNFAAIWSGTAVNYIDNSTTDFGSTAGMVLSGSISGSNMVIFASGSTAGWTFKGIIKSI